MNVQENTIPYTTLENLYGDDNRFLDEFFPENGYINFGYYPYPIDRFGPITTAERVKSEEALYDYVFKKLDLQPEDHVLEVGCGRGDGVLRLLSQFPVTSIKGMDSNPQQILRALLKHHEVVLNDSKLSFHIGKAEQIPFKAESVNKIYSIESAQHFDSIGNFAKECKRVLRSFGKVVVTTFFAKDRESLNRLKKMMPINIGRVDNVQTEDEIKKAFHDAGFTLVMFEEIGKHIFPFFDQWLAERKTQNWGRLWAKAWREGLIEYEILTFQSR